MVVGLGTEVIMFGIGTSAAGRGTGGCEADGKVVAELTNLTRDDGGTDHDSCSGGTLNRNLEQVLVCGA